MDSSEEFENLNIPEAQVSASPRPRVPASWPRPVSVSPRLRLPASLLTWLARISRFLLAALFVFTAVAKLAIVKSFAQNMAQLLSASGFNYERWSWPATVAVIAIEIAVAILLLWPRTIRIGAFCAGLLLLAFAGYALYYVYILKGEPLECGCFGGIIASQLGVTTALRNLALLIPAVFVWIGYKRAIRIPESVQALA
jgi:hypothetical protein